MCVCVYLFAQSNDNRVAGRCGLMNFVCLITDMNRVFRLRKHSMHSVWRYCVIVLVSQYNSEPAKQLTNSNCRMEIATGADANGRQWTNASPSLVTKGYELSYALINATTTQNASVFTHRPQQPNSNPKTTAMNRLKLIIGVLNLQVMIRCPDSCNPHNWW